MSGSSAATESNEGDEFIVHAIKSKDGTVETPPVPTSGPLGIGHYNDMESSSSSESPSSPASPSLEQTFSKEDLLPNGKTFIAANKERRSKHKRVRFADEVNVAEPVAKIPRLESGEEEKMVEEDEEDLDEEMAFFEAEVGALNGGSGDADMELAEIEDGREEAAQEELRMRVKKLRERLNNVGGKQGSAVTVVLAGEKVPLRMWDRRTDKQGTNSNMNENEEEEDGDVDLLADWSEFPR